MSTGFRPAVSGAVLGLQGVADRPVGSPFPAQVPCSCEQRARVRDRGGARPHRGAGGVLDAGGCAPRIGCAAGKGSPGSGCGMRLCASPRLVRPGSPLAAFIPSFVPGVMCCRAAWGGFEIALTQVGGHIPGPAIVTVATGSGPVPSDAVHYYEELERDRPFPWRSTSRTCTPPSTRSARWAPSPGRVVAGHDPLVAERFGSRAGSADVILLSLAALRRATVRVLVTVKRVKVAGLAKDD